MAVYTFVIHVALAYLSAQKLGKYLKGFSEGSGIVTLYLKKHPAFFEIINIFANFAAKVCRMMLNFENAKQSAFIRQYIEEALSTLDLQSTYSSSTNQIMFQSSLTTSKSNNQDILMEFESSKSVPEISRYEERALENARLGRENDMLRAQIKEMEPMKEQNRELRICCSDQAILIRELKQKLAEAQRNILAQENNTISTKEPSFEYHIDITHFDNNPTYEDTIHIFDVLLEITDYQTVTGRYLLDYAVSVLPVYLVMSDTNANIDFHYRGPFSEFCEAWNYNVAGRITDPKRMEKLKVSYSALLSEMHKAPWKNCSPVSWKRLVNQSDVEDLKKLQRAYNIQIQIEHRLSWKNIQSA